ncbi:MAG: hypothetical protein J5983_00290 [Ruminococcus sp.]|nr:hypothetical protein [Ruminococcus sp.]
MIAVICSFLGIFNYGEEQIEEAYVLMEQKEYAAASQQFEAAIDQAEETAAKEPNEERERYVLTEAYRGLGMISYEVDDYQMCREYLQKALDEGAEATPVMYNLIGISSMRQEDYEGALSAFEQGTALQAEENQTGTEDTATEDSGETAAAEPEDYSEVYREMRYNTIICYEKLLDWEGAKFEAEEYLALYPEDEDIQKEYTFLKSR